MTLELGDMIFYSIAGLVVIVLFWLRFLEPHLDLWGAVVVWLAWTGFLFSRFRGKGPQKAGP